MTDWTELVTPRLRYVEAVPVEHQGERLIALRDTADPSLPPIAVSQDGLAVLSLMDGSRTIEMVQNEARVRWGIDAPRDALVALVTALDEAYLLQGERYDSRVRQLRSEFRSLSVRPAIHAGGAYLAEPTALRRFMDDQFRQGPGAVPVPSSRPSIGAAIIPHVDLHRGGPTYAWGYHALAEAPPAECYLLLGTCHNLMSRPFAALRIPYDTPFGPAPLDAELLSLLERDLGDDLFEDELSHRAEHSLEFQAVYLRALGLVGESGGTIVPILCQALQAYVPPGESPQLTQSGAAFLGALKQAIQTSGKQVCVIAGADLAHVGPQFGDPTPVTADALDAVRSGDEAMLELVCQRDMEGFYQQVMADGDARRICGLAPIYYTLALTGGAPGQVLRYTQWADPNGQSAVTFASVVFAEAV